MGCFEVLTGTTVSCWDQREGSPLILKGTQPEAIRAI